MSLMAVQVSMALAAALEGKRTLICVATRERAVAVREEFGLEGHKLINVVAIDPPLHAEQPREVTFVSFENVRAIPRDTWALLDLSGDNVAPDAGD